MLSTHPIARDGVRTPKTVLNPYAVVHKSKNANIAIQISQIGSKDLLVRFKNLLVFYDTLETFFILTLH